MEICLTATPMLETMLPDQKPDTAKSYRPSLYNCIHRSGDRIYLYNTMTRRLAQLSSGEAALLENAQLPGSSPEAVPLIAKRFLVPQETDEAAQYLQLFSTQELFLSTTDRGMTMYEILPTTGCNARCFYCFEQGVQVKNMTEETADAVVSFIKKTRDPEKKLHLAWFGGEPLLRPAIIDRICEALTAAGIEFYSTMTTNGSLFAPELIEKAQSCWRLDKVQITLDGVGEEHDRRKAYVALPDAYFVTVRNIARLVDAGIGVTVRMNMDMGNYIDIARAYDRVSARYTPKDRIVFDPQMLRDGWFEKNLDRTGEQQLLRENWKALREKIWHDGFYRVKPLSDGLPRWHCMANSTASTTILPDGTLSMCQTGCEGMYYGDVRSGITQPELVKKWQDRTVVREKCRTCPYLPECTAFTQCPAQQGDCRELMADTFRMRLATTVRSYENKK